MTKQEKIQEAYGIYWDTFSSNSKECAIKNNGWISSILDHAPKDLELDFANGTYRPKSLQGIDNNNGWVKIYCENDMPQFDCDCFIIDKIKGVVTGQWRQAPNEVEDKKARAFWLSKATHYKIIEKPKFPLY